MGGSEVVVAVEASKGVVVVDETEVVVPLLMQEPSTVDFDAVELLESVE